MLGRQEDEDEMQGGNRKRVQGGAEREDARPAKVKRVAKTVVPGNQLATSEAEPSTSGKSDRMGVDANHGVLFKFFKPIRSKTERGEQSPNNSILNVEQLSLLGSINGSQRRLAERESGTKVINKGAQTTKSRRDKLPDS